jgi:hypothetical protein
VDDKPCMIVLYSSAPLLSQPGMKVRVLVYFVAFILFTVPCLPCIDCLFEVYILVRPLPHCRGYPDTSECHGTVNMVQSVPVFPCVGLEITFSAQNTAMCISVHSLRSVTAVA